MLNKAVLISIRPEWCDLIASGKKTIEVRKTRPQIDAPFNCYIYETKSKTEYPAFIDEEGHEIYEGRGQVIGEFVCDDIKPIRVRSTGSILFCSNLCESCLTLDEVAEYIGREKKGYGWHISDLKIYDEPRKLKDFDLERAPQSWRYVWEAFKVWNRRAVDER